VWFRGDGDLHSGAFSRGYIYMLGRQDVGTTTTSAIVLALVNALWRYSLMNGIQVAACFIELQIFDRQWDMCLSQICQCPIIHTIAHEPPNAHGTHGSCLVGTIGWTRTSVRSEFPNVWVGQATADGGIGSVRRGVDGEEPVDGCTVGSDGEYIMAVVGCITSLAKELLESKPGAACQTRPFPSNGAAVAVEAVGASSCVAQVSKKKPWYHGID
jgi:hypothetical protein